MSLGRRPTLALALSFIVTHALSGCGDEAARGTLAALETENSAGRHGVYYLPEGYAGEALPLLLIYHGTDGNGAWAANDFAAWADRDRFIVLAPDSRVAPDGRFAWEVGNAALSQTEDYLHTQALIEELESLDGIHIDWERALAAGHSGGGAMAPYIATNDVRFDGYAVLHGGVIRGGMGQHVVPGWFSTGEEDTFRPPDHVEGQAAYMSEELGFPDVRVHVYPGGHSISGAEKRALIDWWFEL